MGVVLCGVGVVLLGVLVLISPVEGALSPLVSAQGDHGTGAFMVVGDRNLNESSWQDLKSSIERLSSQGRVNCVIDGLQKVVTVQLSQPNLVKVRSIVGVAYVEEETRVEGVQESLSWHVDRLDQPRLPLNQEFQPIGSGAGVDVYVLDSGVFYNHEQLNGRSKYSGYDPMDVHKKESRRGQDCHGHGTQVASAIVGRSLGVAGGSRVYSVRVLDCENRGVWSVVIDGLEHVSEVVAQRGRPAVLVMAFIGPRSQTVNSALRKLYIRGILAVASAGNDFQDSCRYTPGGMAEVLTAGGTDRDDRMYQRSNYGACVDVFAPAVDIPAADMACDTCYTQSNGTSFSAALTAGVAAIILGQEPLLAPLDLKRKVVSTGVSNIINLPASVRSFTTNKFLQVPGGCGGQYTVPATITSPGYPAHYPDGLLDPCKWTVTTAGALAGSQIQCTFRSFKTEVNHDLVSVCDGLTCCPSSILAGLSGTVATPLVYVSSSGAITVELLTDSSNSNQGFTLQCSALGDMSTLTTPTSSTPQLPTTFIPYSTFDSLLTTPTRESIRTTSSFSTSLRTSQPTTVPVATRPPTTSNPEHVSSELTSTAFISESGSSPSSQPRTYSPTLSPATKIYSTEGTSAVSSGAESPSTNPITGSPDTDSPDTDSTVTDSPDTDSLEGTPFAPRSTLTPPEVSVNRSAALVGVVSEVVSEVVVLLQGLVNESGHTYLSSKVQGQLQQFPLQSCQQLASAFMDSGDYWLRSGNGSAVRMFCDMSSSFGEHGGYMLVADMDMSRQADGCPATLQTRTDICGKRLCGRGDALPGCSVVTYHTYGIPYQRVCGRVLAYQVGSPNGFFAYHLDGSLSLSEAYVDGVSLSWGSSPKNHIWTFAAVANTSIRDVSFNCPGEWPLPSELGPGFVDRHYFCDALSEEGLCARPLWSESGCGLINGCSAPMLGAWFCVNLGQIVTEDIELRVCGNEDVNNEDTPLETVSLYVQ